MPINKKLSVVKFQQNQLSSETVHMTEIPEKETGGQHTRMLTETDDKDGTCCRETGAWTINNVDVTYRE